MATDVVVSATPVGMLVPVYINNLHGNLHPLEAGHIAIRSGISFLDFLSRLERNLVHEFGFSRHVLVITVDRVTNYESAGSYISSVHEGFDFSEVVENGKKGHFILDVVVVDGSWDMDRGDTVIEFECWREGKEQLEEDNNKGIVGYGKREMTLPEDFPCLSWGDRSLNSARD